MSTAWWRMVGVTLFISGACTGVGMLALPVVLAPLGFSLSLAAMTGAWLFTMLTGMLALEANLWLPAGTNFVSMAKNTLGTAGELLTGAAFILLLYSLLASCATVGGNMVHAIALDLLGNDLSISTSAAIWTGFFALIVTCGVDLSVNINLVVIVGLMTSIALLSAILAPQVDLSLLTATSGHAKHLFYALPILMTAFCFQVLIPLIREYLGDRTSLMTLAIILGTAIPFLIFVLWVSLVGGVVPVGGEAGLIAIGEAGDPTGALIQTLAAITSIPWLVFVVRFFAFFAIASSLLAVGLGLFDLLADWLHIQKDILGRITLALLAFFPPYFFALFFPEGFLFALGFASIFVALLNGILPAIMVWSGRYCYWKSRATYTVWGGKPLLITVFGFSVVIIISELFKYVHAILGS